MSDEFKDTTPLKLHNTSGSEFGSHGFSKHRILKLKT